MKARTYILCAAIAGAGALLLSLSVGAAGISLGDLWNTLWGQGSSGQTEILFHLRLPRTIAAWFVGGGLAVAGACLQGMFENPMADPQILGVSSGAGLGAALAIAMGSAGVLGQLGVTGAAFLGGILAMVAVFMLSGGGRSVRSLLLSGIALSSLFTALVSCVMILNRNKMDQIMLWSMGGFNAITWPKIAFLVPVTLLSAGGCMLFSKDLNILSAGEEDAWHLGVDVRKLRMRLSLLVALLCAAAVSVAGMIGFVGLMVPHFVRLLIGPDHRKLLPASFLTGGVFLLLMDTLARTIAAPLVLPVGVLTAICGVPFLLYLLQRRSRV